MRSNDLLLLFSESSTSTLSSAWVQKQSTEPAVFPVFGQKAKHHRPRQLERGACLCIMAREHSLLSANVDKTLSRRLARAQSASEILSSVPILFAWNTQNVVYEFLVKSIS